MPATRNLCAQLPLDLHQRVCEAREESGLTTAQYITQLLTEYYEMKENGGKALNMDHPPERRVQNHLRGRHRDRRFQRYFQNGRERRDPH